MTGELSRLLLQEQRLRFQSFNENDGWALGSLARDLASARSLPIAIEIRHASRPLFYSALIGSDGDNPDWLRRKINVVQRYYKSSYRVGMELAQKGTSLGPDRGVDPMSYAPHGGAFPIHVAGTGVIGAIAVSGLPQREDHNLVVEVLCQFLKVPHDEVKLAPEA